MYKSIYVAVDNSDYSNKAAEIAVDFAKHFGSTVIGSHAYAAKMHDKRFKQMEAGLPEEYHDEKELEKQRRIHDSLITRGLEIITDSYLDIIHGKCKNANIAFEARSLEGRNFQVLAQDINENKYDLVVMGALGVGAVRESLIGGVTERVVRRVRYSDIFIVKDLNPIEGAKKIFVCLDGSHQAFGGLKTAVELGKALGMEVEALAAFDPYFHYAAFNSIAGVLSEEAGKVFRFKEQEKLHEEVIDSGLAKIYQAHLDIGKQIAEEDGMKIKTTLLDGKAFERILQYCRKEKPWLVIMGRIGVHSDDTMDIGSNSENLLRMISSNVLISNRTFVPPIDTMAEYTIAWTDEAKRRMERVPVFARGVAKTAIYRYAVEKGHTIISNEVVDSAMGHLLPESSIRAMKRLGEALEEKKIDRDKMQGSDEVIQDLMGGSAQMMGLLGTTVAAGTGASGTLTYDQRRDLPYFMCGGCGYIAKGDQPVKCPICAAEGTEFGMIDKSIIQEAAKAEGNIEVELAYDDVQIEWTSEGKTRLRQVPSGYLRRRAKAIIEKSARKRGIRTITTDFASEVITQYAEEKDNWKDEIMGIKSADSKENTSGSSWDEQARQRLERVPAGYMRDSTQITVEEYAASIGVQLITLEVANDGIEKAKKIMEESMKNPEALQAIMNKLAEAKKKESLAK
ncbi:MAG: universal stress protein [Nitrospirae bacterium]|nr:universal stress protein [Nitrospirota bacterium]MBI3352527.1 universal stress protein [Nitrospirota bacterium]